MISGNSRKLPVSVMISIFWPVSFSTCLATCRIILRNAVPAVLPSTQTLDICPSVFSVSLNESPAWSAIGATYRRESRSDCIERADVLTAAVKRSDTRPASVVSML